MAKTSEQLYDQINALNASDGDARTENLILKNLSLAIARLAMEAETIQDIYGPTSSVDSTDIYDEINAVDAADADRKMTAIMMQKLGLAFARVSMAFTGIKESLSEGWNVATKAVTLTATPTISKKIACSFSANITATPSQVAV